MASRAPGPVDRDAHGSRLTAASGVETAGRRIGLGHLALVFVRLGATAFGGLLVLLAMLEREFVDRRGLLTRAELAEAVTYTRLLPGSGGPLVVSYLGYRLGGAGGSVIATVAYLLPGVLMMIGLAVGFVGASNVPAIASAIDGLLAAVIGVQAVMAVRFARRSVVDGVTAAIFVVALAGGLLADVSVLAIVLGAGVFGAIFRPVGREPEAA